MNTKTIKSVILLVLSSVSVTLAASSTLDKPQCHNYSATKMPFYGDLHVHTALSFDAVQLYAAADPDDAYNFAKGAPLVLKASGVPDRTVQLERNLDFAAVTDHAEWLAASNVCFDESNKTLAYYGPYCKLVRAGRSLGGQIGGLANVISVGPNVLPNGLIEAIKDVLPPSATPAWLQRLYEGRESSVCSIWSGLCDRREAKVWKDIQKSADNANDTSANCGFTAFRGYEWTGMPLYNNMHRNVIFDGNKATEKAYGYFDAPTPEKLWRLLDKECNDKKGCQVIAIPHNANLSGGLLYPERNSDFSAFTAESALKRQEMEPLSEIMQAKGASECFYSPGNPFGASDEECGFEQVIQKPICDMNNPSDDCVKLCSNMLVPVGGFIGWCVEPKGFLRGALRRGLVVQDKLGVNPFKFGFIGSTDTHNGTPGHVDEFNFQGHHGSSEATVSQRVSSPASQGGTLGGISFVNPARFLNPGGLAVVWAEQNTRSALFKGMKNRETYATSGTRITLRMFAGFDLPNNICANENYAQQGYATGVPMGGDLYAPKSGSVSSPKFTVSAMKDPGTVLNPGSNLQKIQMVKVWESNGQSYEKVYDIAGDSVSSATPDPLTCAPATGGYANLCTVWTDPTFDANENASYYSRVIENSSCRYNKRQCNIEMATQNLTCDIIRMDPDHKLSGCCDGKAPDTIKERAWSSPIWYTASKR